VWSFGDEVYAILTDYLRLREKLRPYIRCLMQEAHENGAPVIRPMFFEFPNDGPCWDLADQYMFGPDMLVAPVMEAGIVSRKVYLPAGHEWVEFFTGKKHRSGGIIETETPLERIPVFIKDNGKNSG
jgi:alpha-D-xyloside xylohydrolase